MDTRKIVNVVLLGGALIVALSACESDYKASGGDAALLEARLGQREADARMISDRFLAKDPSLRRFFDTSAGYAVYPEITKGAAGIGGAHGEGVVFEHGVPIGYTTLSQATIGLQLGGQVYHEIIFFQSPQKLDEFRRGNMELSAQASAVAADEGKAANADFAHGVAVFTMVKEGLMGEASVGGQKFTYSDKANAIYGNPAPIRDAGSVPPPQPVTSPSPR